MAVSWCVLFSGCTTTSGTNDLETEGNLLDRQGNVTLHVSNQSFAVNPVDIRIEVDGQTVINETFDVGTGARRQHNWKTYRLALDPGMHKLRVVSTKGEAELSEDFRVQGEHWAVLDYWYYPKSHYNPTPKHFSFNIQDEPLHFQ